MKTISMWQPWATLFLLTDPEEKLYETRSFYAAHRGPLLIHAAKTRNAEVRDFLGCRYLQERLALHGLNVTDLAFGALVGTVELKGCSRMDRMPEPNEQEQKVGNWEPLRFAWERGPRTQIFKEAIPYTGKQGFFDVPYAVVAHQLLEPMRGGGKSLVGLTIPAREVER